MDHQDINFINKGQEKHKQEEYRWYQSPAILDPTDSIRIHPLENLLFDLHKPIEVLSKNRLLEKDMKSVHLSHYRKKCPNPL